MTAISPIGTRNGASLAREAPADDPKTTNELAAYIATAKGLDARDAIMRKIICRKIIHQLRRQTQQGNLVIAGRKQAALGWQLLQKP